MHILFVTPNYPTPGNPFTAFVAAFCEEAARQGNHISVVAPCNISSHIKHHIPIPPRHELIDIGAGIEVFRLHYMGLGYGGRIRRAVTTLMIRIVTEFCVWRRKINADVIYGQFFLFSLVCVHISQRKGIPIFVDCGEDVIQPNRHIGKHQLQKALRQINGVVCVSQKNREECITKGYSQEENTRVFVNGYNPIEFYPTNQAEQRRMLGLPPDAFIVIFCGRFNHRKGAMRVQQAVRQLEDPQIKTIYIGRPVENETWMPSGDEVLFCGTLPHDQIVHYLGAADVYVFPTLMEGCPNTTIEAMACGLPIVSSDCSFNYDILDKDNAILLDPMDIDAIATAIKQLKDNPDLRKRMSAASLRKASSLTIENRVRSILNFICQRKGDVN
ncbi:MAG: glycosyltransferase family 4 protein [Bacteroidales bacterium]|nr:glycosyltransferase family 4 protein [Bacteroidales bacterium]